MRESAGARECSASKPRTFRAIDGTAITALGFSSIDIAGLAAVTGGRDITFAIGAGISSSRRAGGAKSTEILIELTGIDAANAPLRSRHAVFHPGGAAPLTAIGVSMLIERLTGLDGNPATKPGLTKAPPRGRFDYSFESLANVVGGFVEAIGLARYALYIFDYGAPVGLRLAMKHPERVTAIITQNGNAYVEGLSKEWGPWQTYWREPTPEHREATRASLSDAAIRFQYEHGAPAGLVSPDGYMLDTFYMHRPGASDIQLDLILSYRTNVALYPAFQAYFRQYRPPTLAVWGKHDAFFLPSGAHAYRRDNPDADIHLLDAGHFALETHHREIAGLMRVFLDRTRR